MMQAISLELLDVVQAISDCSAKFGEPQRATAEPPRLEPLLAHPKPPSCLGFRKPDAFARLSFRDCLFGHAERILHFQTFKPKTALLKF